MNGSPRDFRFLFLGNAAFFAGGRQQKQKGSGNVALPSRRSEDPKSPGSTRARVSTKPRGDSQCREKSGTAARQSRIDTEVRERSFDKKSRFLARGAGEWFPVQLPFLSLGNAAFFAGMRGCFVLPFFAFEIKPATTIKMIEHLTTKGIAKTGKMEVSRKLLKVGRF